MRRPRLRSDLTSVLLSAAAALLFASLFAVWREPADAFQYFGDYDQLVVLVETGWERWRVLDVALTALAAGFLSGVVIRHRALVLVLVLSDLAAAACIAISLFEEGAGTEPPTPMLSISDVAAGPGPILALVALTLAILALAPLLRRPRAPTL